MVLEAISSLRSIFESDAWKVETVLNAEAVANLGSQVIAACGSLSEWLDRSDAPKDLGFGRSTPSGNSQRQPGTPRLPFGVWPTQPKTNWKAVQALALRCCNRATTLPETSSRC